MSAKFTLTKNRIHAGIYQGLLETRSKDQPTPEIEMIHLGHVVGEVEIIRVEGQTNQWLVSAHIPTETLVDGVQTYNLVFAGQSEILDRFSIITGEPLEDDLRAEFDLMRAELDMLKKAFRRHCVETM